MSASLFPCLSCIGKLIAWEGSIFSLLLCFVSMAGIVNIETVQSITFPENDTSVVGRQDETNRQDKIVITTVIVWTLLFIGLFDVITSVMLLLGIRKNSHVMLLPWIFIEILKIVSCLAFLCTYIYFLDMPIFVTYNLVILFLALGFQFGKWMLVYTLFKRIKRTNSQRNFFRSGSLRRSHSNI